MIYNTLFKGYCVAGNTTRTTALFEEMSQQDVNPDTNTVNAHLSGCLRAGDVGDAYEVFTKMASDWDAEPDFFTYKRYLQMLSRGLRLDSLMEICTKLQGLQSWESKAAGGPGSAFGADSSGVEAALVWLHLHRGLSAALLGRWEDAADALAQVEDAGAATAVAPEVHLARNTEKTTEDSGQHEFHLKVFQGEIDRLKEYLNSQRVLLGGGASDAGSAAGGGADGTMAELRAELSTLKPRGLQKRAEKMGVDDELLDIAEDNAATVELCVEKAAADAAAAGGGGEIEAIPASDLQGPLCKTFIFGTHTNAQARKQNDEASAGLAPEEELAVGLVRSLERTFGLDVCIERGLFTVQKIGAVLCCFMLFLYCCVRVFVLKKRKLAEERFRKHLQDECLHWHKLFGNKRVREDLAAAGDGHLPVKLEICSGFGEWVIAQAKAEAGVANWGALVRFSRVRFVYTCRRLIDLSLCVLAGAPI